jgi:peptide/nickel transport system permease protein
VISPYEPAQQDLEQIFAAPSSEHWLGTDHLGRDVLSRLLHAARVDLQVGLIAVIAPLCLGTAVGLVAGYFGRATDTIVMRLADVVVAFPFLVLVLALVFVLGPGTTSIYIAITAVGWVSYARIVRGEVLVAKRQEYVAAARAAGMSHARILVRHVLPNVTTQSIVYAMSDVVLTILAVVTLSYLGLGVQPPTPEWGTMIVDGQAVLADSWWIATAPGVAVVLTGLALALIGDGLADVLRVRR